MSTDRELLELAAKAAGLKGCIFEFQGLETFHFTVDGESTYWNPLTDDGDALRLACGIGFDVRILRGEANYTEIEKRKTNIGRAVERHGDDPCLATRRAIVRAAAEMGRSMK